MEKWDIYDELSFAFFRMSGGNPYLIQDLVQERNLRREELVDIHDKQ